MNDFGRDHSRTTCMDFKVQVLAAATEAYEEGKLDKPPSWKIQVMDNPKMIRKKKFLNESEVKKLIEALDLTTLTYDVGQRIKTSRLLKSGMTPNYDLMIYLALKTGLRFAEICALHQSDFCFETRMLNVDKTLNYKFNMQIENRTKTISSKRRIALDVGTCWIFKSLFDKDTHDNPIFIPDGFRMFSSTVNNRLNALCKEQGITGISFHGLRHTHGSLLLGNGISMHSISKRLGHAKVSITQDIYLHLTQEIENKDNDLIAGRLAGF